MDVNTPMVLKLGGSLLTLPDLFDRLLSVIEMLKTDRLLLIPGGGASANEVRHLDDRFQLSAASAHWAAIAAMSANASMLARLSGFLRVAESRLHAECVWASGRVAILNSLPFLQNEERCADASPLPASWDVTSDSIAAWIAYRWPASRLIIAKSCDSDGLSVRELIACNKLDARFSRMDSAVPVYWLNLRHDPLTLLPLSGKFDSR